MIFHGVACDSCGELFPEKALDEDRCCDGCRLRMRRRMRWGSHLIAAVVTLPFATWVLVLDKTEFLPPAAWLLPLTGAYYLGFRIGREVVKGYTSWRRTR